MLQGGRIMWGKWSKLLALIFGEKAEQRETRKSEALSKTQLPQEPIRKVTESKPKIMTQEVKKVSLADQQATKEKRDLIIGFDLGTACTKVVIRDPSIELVHAIPLSNESDPLRKYLLPTEIGYSSRDGFSLERSNQNIFIRHLKLLLMEKADEGILISDSPKIEISGLEITAAYVAMILRKSREWFLKERAKVYEGYDIIWHLNVGIPAKNYDDKETKENFEKMAIGAWWLSVQNFPITHDLCGKMKRLVSNPDFQPGIPRDQINVIPEIAAQFAGYARSKLREEGLHMLVDIGASTLDTATFLLNKKEEDDVDRYVFLAALIERLGAIELHYHRIEKVRDYFVKWVKDCRDCIDMLSPIPDFPDGYRLDFDNLTGIDEEFLREVCRSVRWVVALTKTQRDPNSEKWVEGLPIFLCGGGSHLAFYNPRMLQRVQDQLYKSFKWNGFRVSTLPKPENLKAEGLRSRDYHRLSVAYGLSFRYDDIGMIVPPTEVDDVIRPKSIREYEFISKEHV